MDDIANSNDPVMRVRRVASSSHGRQRHSNLLHPTSNDSYYYYHSNPIIRMLIQHYYNSNTTIKVTIVVVTIVLFYSYTNNGYVSTTRSSSSFVLRGTHTSRKNIITIQLHDQWIKENEVVPFNFHNMAVQAEHLIIVAGHSVTISGHLEDADRDERDWYLLPYQKHRGLPDAIIGHIKAGIMAAIYDPAALLIFSGGQTRATTGPESEGSSYYRVADAMQLWTTATTTSTTASTTTDESNDSTTTTGRDTKETITNETTSEQQKADGSSSSNNNNNNNKKDQQASIVAGRATVRARTVTEEFATDSFENLLFSICRFYEITGRYPTQITVVSFTFKEHRFRTLHIPAIQYPDEQFHYIGYDPDPSTGFNYQEASTGEQENAAKPFETDPYGCHTAVLQEKRQQRNPFRRTPPYSTSCPQMKELLQYCGPIIISKDKVPW